MSERRRSEGRGETDWGDSGSDSGRTGQSKLWQLSKVQKKEAVGEATLGSE